MTERLCNVIGAQGDPLASSGVDHGVFPWSPLPSRPPLRWPGQAAVAVAVVLDLGAVEWERPGQEPAVPPPGGRGVQPYPDLPRMAHREYGHRVGVFRLLGALQRLDIRPGAALDVLTVERYKPLLDHVLPAVDEVLAHGLSASRPITSRMHEEEERHYVLTTLSRLEAALGHRPRGWLGPEHSESTRTPALLAEAGLDYVADWGNDDQPYPLPGAGASLWSFPLSYELSDLSTAFARKAGPGVQGRTIRDAFDVLRAEGTVSGRVLALHLHPWIRGSRSASQRSSRRSSTSARLGPRGSPRRGPSSTGAAPAPQGPADRARSSRDRAVDTAGQRARHQVQRREQVYRDLKSMIMDNGLAPGASLAEKELSERLGASRTPVREALQRLAREGLVRLVPGRGAFISEISIPDVIELFQMREALEPYAVRLAARSPDRRSVVPLLEELATGDELIDRDPAGYYSLTARLDGCIVELAGNERLRLALDEVWTQIRRARRVASANPRRLSDSVGEHVAILQAIGDGDQEAGEAAARVHVRRSLRHILSASSTAADGGLTED